MNDKFVSGSYRFGTRVKVNALAKAGSGLPSWVGYCHETAHMEIATSSAVGLFQGLLRLLDQSPQLTAEELTALRGLEGRLTEATFKTHEGVAVYCASVHILERELDLLPKYINTLSEPYRNAFRRVAPLLPKPQGLFESNKDTYRYRSLAVLLGMYCCSTPIFDSFESRDRLLEWQTIDFEAPDARLRNAGRQAPKLLDIAERMSPVLAADISRIWDDDLTRLEGHDRLQAVWIDWTTQYEKLIVESGLPNDTMSLEALRHKLDALIRAWGLSEHVKTPSQDKTNDASSLLRTEVYLPGQMTLQIRADLRRPEDVQALLAGLGDTLSPTLLVALDFLPESFTATTKFRVNDGGELTCEHEDPGDMEIIIVEEGAGLLPLSQTPIPVSRFKANATDVRKIVPSTASDGFLWVVDGLTYIRRQMLTGLAQYPPAFAFPRVLMHFTSLSGLLSGMQTLLPPFNDHAYVGVIGWEPPLAFLAVGNEFMFAFVPHMMEAETFLDSVKEMGARDWEFTEPEMQEQLSVCAKCGLVGIHLLNALRRDDGH